MDTLNNGDDAFNADRVVKSLPPLARFPLRRGLLYEKVGNKEVPNVDRLRKHFIGEGKLKKTELVELITNVTKILREEPNMLHLKEPIVIVGDIHG